MHRREFILVGVTIAGATAIGAVAFTTATVERELTIDITSDEQGIIGLTPGDSDAVEIVDGRLTIDMSTGLSDGLNPDGEFNYGDAGNPTTSFAFSVTNNDNSEREFTLSLDNFTFDPPAELTLPLYEDDGSLLGELTPDTSQTVTIDSGSPIYVHIEANTEGLDEGDTMSGTLRIDVQ